MGGGPPEGRGPRRGPRPALRTEAAPGAGCAPGCSGGTGVQEAAGETGVFTGPGDRLLWAVRGSFRALPAVPCTVPPRRPSPHVGVSPGRAWPAGGAGSPCWPLCLDPPGRLPRASLRRCAAHAGPLRVPVSLCAGQARWWACTAPLLPLGPPRCINLLFPRPACLAYARPPRASESRAPPRALQARPSGDRRALRRTGAPRRVVSPGGGRSATGHGAGARGRAGREAGCALRGGQRRAPGRGGAALPGRATAGLAARGGRSSRTGPPCSGPGASRVKLTCLTTV